MDGYSIWAVVFFLAAAGISCLIQFYYTKNSWKTMPIITHVSLIVSIGLCVLPFPLLVLDVDAALTARDMNQTVNPVDDWVKVWWMIIFFATQIMAWAVLPICQEYDGAGQFTPGERFKHAVKENVRMYIILGIVAAILMGYIFFISGVNSIDGMIAMSLAAANAFGLVVLVIFFACGLVGVPKHLWHLSSPTLLLRESFRQVRHFHEELDITKTEMTLIRAEVVRRDPLVDESERGHLAMMLDEISQLEKDIPLAHTNVSDRAVENQLKEKSLVALNAELKRMLKMCRRLHYQYQAKMHESHKLQRVVNGEESSQYWTIFRRPLLVMLSVIAAITTLLVLFSEAVVPFQKVTDTPISIVEIVVTNPTLRFVGSVGFLYYMAGCGYWAVFQFRVFDLYEVVPSISDGASMCFICTFLTRVMLPLCYNFLFIADLTSQKTLVTYSRLFGNMDVVVFLGEWFNRFMPVAIPILAVLIELKVIHKLMQWIGVEGFETGQESAIQNQQQEDEGKQIVYRELNCELRGVTSTGGAAVATAPVAPKREGPATSKRYEEWKASRAAATV